VNGLRRLLRTLKTLLHTDSPSQVALGQVGASMLALISAPIVARILGPEGRGETAAILAAFYVWPILAAFGMQLEVRRAGVSPGGESSLRRARDVMLLLPLPSAGVGILLVTTLFAGLDDATRITTVIGLSLAPLMVSWMCDQSLLVAHRRYRMVGLVQIMQPTVYLILVLAGWAVGLVSVPYVLTANLLGTAATTVFALSCTRVSLRGHRAPVRGFLANSARYSGSSIAEAAANRLDQLIALPIVGAYQTGLYAVAATIGGIALPMGHALAADSFNKVARAAPEDRAAVRVDHIRTAVAGGILCGIALAAVTPIVVPLLFGAEFAASVPVALVTILGGVASVPAFVAGLILAAEGRGVAMTINQVIRLVVAVVLLLLLGPLWGAMGVAAASAAAVWLLLVLSAVRATGTLAPFAVRPADFGAAIRRLLFGS